MEARQDDRSLIEQTKELIRGKREWISMIENHIGSSDQARIANTEQQIDYRANPRIKKTVKESPNTGGGSVNVFVPNREDEYDKGFATSSEMGEMKEKSNIEEEEEQEKEEKEGVLDGKAGNASATDDEAQNSMEQVGGFGIVFRNVSADDYAE